MPKTHIWTTPTASYPTMVDTLYQKKHESIKYNTLEKEHMSRFSQDYNKNNIISDQTKTSRFYSKISKDWCDITINVRHIKYLDGTDYYYIEYNNVFKNNTENDSEYYDDSHPFYDNTLFLENINGCIVAKNAITESLVKYLLMDFEELEEYCGNSFPDWYKSNIMKSLSLLWD